MIDKKIYTVYEHIFPNAMVYVGLTCQPLSQRWGYNGNGYKKQSIYKYIELWGWENIRHDIIDDQLSKDEAIRIEREYIKYYKDRNMSYNISCGGEIGSMPKYQYFYNNNWYTPEELAFLSPYNISAHDITTRINHHGWDIEDAISKPKMKKDYTYEYNGKRYTAKELLKFSNVDGLTVGNIYSRINKYGWDIERAITQPLNVKIQPKGVGECNFHYNGKDYNSYDLLQKSNIENLSQHNITNRINQCNWDVKKAISTPKKRRNILFNYKGNKYTSKELAEIGKKNGIENLTPGDITDRIRSGWSIEDAVSKPKRKINDCYNYNGKIYTAKQLAEISPIKGMTSHTVSVRIKNYDWNIHDAITKPLKTKTKK